MFTSICLVYIYINSRFTASKHSQSLRPVKPREGLAPKKRTLTLASKIEGIVDKLFSKGKLKFKEDKNILDVIDITDVEMTGDLQLVKIKWRLCAGGKAFAPKQSQLEFHEDRGLQKKKMMMIRSARREESRYIHH